MTAEKIQKIKEMHENGKSISTISKELVISRSSVYYVVDPLKKEQAKKQALANYYKNKEGRRETQKTYYENNREYLRAKQKEYYENNREYLRAKQKEKHKKRRGVDYATQDIL